MNIMFRRCHLGRVIVYDTVTKRGWRVHIVNHAIDVIIQAVLHEDWDPDNGLEVPAIGGEEDCVVSFWCISVRPVPDGDFFRIVSIGNMGIIRTLPGNSFLFGEDFDILDWIFMIVIMRVMLP
jgi:hypothetical protein